MDPPPPNKIDEQPGSAAAPHHEGSGSRPLERRATVGEASSSPPSSHQPHRWRPRSRSVSSACERCRRRKIRCDGEAGPCSTCVRFRVACIRPPKLRSDRMGLGAHRALASRIQQLEAQLAEMGDAHSPAWSEDLWSCTPAQPSLHVDTSFNPPQRSFSWDFSASNDSAGGGGGAEGCGSSSSNGTTTAAQHQQQPDIPTIEISECGGPSSPALLSPAPSLLSANSRCSTPDPYTITTPIMGSALAPPMLGSPASPPVSAACHQRSPWDFSQQCYHDSRNEGAGYLSPPDHGGKLASASSSSLSRRSSVSSLGLDQDFNSINLHFSPPFEDELSQSSPGFGSADPFRCHSRGASDHSTTPTRFEAETLSDIFFDRVEPARRPVEQGFYHTCLDLVYEFAGGAGPEEDAQQQQQHVDVVGFLIPPYSLRMARFYVFMTMAVGMRLRRTGGRMTTTDNALLERCYRLAMRQAERPSFWCEAGGVEAAALLALFAKSGEAVVVQQQAGLSDRMDR